MLDLLIGAEVEFWIKKGEKNNSQWEHEKKICKNINEKTVNRLLIWFRELFPR